MKPMFARKRLDISWSDLAFGMAACLHSPSRAILEHEIESWFAPAAAPERDPGAVACLSIRSGLDLYLRLLALPRGSEVLVSALTIPDMWRVLEHHGLVAVPVDIDPLTLAPRMDAMERGRTDRTRAVLVAHLLGTHIDLDPIAAFAQRHGLLLWEDCAQAFTDPGFRGHAQSDLAMFSFGPIKTAAALAGAVLVMPDASLRARWRSAHSQYPLQSTRGYFGRLWKYSLLKFLTLPLPYALFVRACEWRGTTHDAVIQSTVRGFIGGDFFERIRHAPSRALLNLMARRLRHADGARVHARTAVAERLIAQLGPKYAVPGLRAPVHTHWVFTLLADRPQELVSALRAEGFDATQVATMKAVAPPQGRPELAPRQAEEILKAMVYLPVYPELPDAELLRLAGVLQRCAQTQLRPLAG
jgi:dTDP-4-amino-4,6-dideoxygalactose transaminase